MGQSVLPEPAQGGTAVCHLVWLFSKVVWQVKIKEED